jgi:hypothetical protein
VFPLQHVEVCQSDFGSLSVRARRRVGVMFRRTSATLSGCALVSSPTARSVSIAMTRLAALGASICDRMVMIVISSA